MPSFTSDFLIEDLTGRVATFALASLDADGVSLNDPQTSHMAGRRLVTSLEACLAPATWSRPDLGMGQQQPPFHKKSISLAEKKLAQGIEALPKRPSGQSQPHMTALQLDEKIRENPRFAQIYEQLTGQ